MAIVACRVASPGPPPPVVAVVDVPKDFYVDITPDALAFRVQVSREQGLIKGDPDPKSSIYP